MDRRYFLKLASQSALVPAAIGLTLSCSRSKESTLSIEDKDLDQLILKLLSETKTPGLSLAIIRNGEVTWNKAFGVKDTKKNEAVDIDTTFEAASMSKTVFAYAVMKLCEKNIMNLDTPLSQYHPKLFNHSNARFKTITARHVLSHRTGLPNWRSKEEPLNFHFDPGMGFLYSGEGYYHLQTVVTHLVGKAYDTPCEKFENDLLVCATDIADYLHQNILVPFGMTSSSYLWSEQLGKNAAAAHDVEWKIMEKKHQGAVDMARYASAGGLLTNAKDFAKFIISLFEGKSNDPFRLNAASLAEMFRPQVKLPLDEQIDGCTSWALGWGVIESPKGNVIVHSGGHPGFRSLSMASVEKKSGFVALTNSDHGGKVIYALPEALSDLW